MGAFDRAIASLRTATEDDVAKALTDAAVAFPIGTEVEMLEAFNCMLDVLTGEREHEQAEDLRRITEAAGTTTSQ